jgi:hypothetical protein
MKTAVPFSKLRLLSSSHGQNRVRQFTATGRALAIRSTAADAETDETPFASCVNRSLCSGFLLCALCGEKQGWLKLFATAA